MIIQHSMVKIVMLVAVMVAVLLGATPTIAQNVLKDNAELLSNYAGEDVVAIAYFDLKRFELDQALNAADELGFTKKEILSDVVELAPAINAAIGKLNSAGMTGAFAIIRISDLTDAATSWVVTCKPGTDVENAANVLKKFELGPFAPHFAEIETSDGVILVTGNQDQMKTLKSTDAVESRFLDAASSLGSGAAGLVVFGDQDSRRAIKELMPALPEPFNELTGKFIADHILWGGIELRLNQNLGAKVVLETSDEGSAAKLANIIKQSFSLLDSMPRVDSFLSKNERHFVFDSLSPQQNKTRITLTTKQLTADKNRLAQILTPALESARQQKVAADRLKNLRMIALAIHNFESAHKHFPTQSTVDDNGKPLLSWRVQILPFMEQGELYNKFHHDEPWDSEHNLKLVKEMPFFYKDLPKQNNQAGKTVFQVPSGKGLLFDGPKESTFGEITDGSSNTIMAIIVAEAHAVIWTKPDDWNVDLTKPLEKLKAPDRKIAEAVTFDGATHRFSLEAPQDVWRNVIVHNHGNIVDLQSLDPK